jgi:hypothetical protein
MPEERRFGSAAECGAGWTTFKISQRAKEQVFYVRSDPTFRLFILFYSDNQFPRGDSNIATARM